MLHLHTVQSNTSNQSGAVKAQKQIVSIISQIRALRSKDNWLAFVVGGLIGSFVPVAVFSLNHHVLGETHSLVAAIREGGERWALLGLILAGAVFSAKSVFGWGLSAFAGDWVKALGYCVLIEGVMVLSPLEWLRVVAMVYLVLINVIATGANLMEVEPEMGDLDTLLAELARGRSKQEVAEQRGISVRHLNRKLATARV